jgi:hypothetical protein
MPYFIVNADYLCLAKAGDKIQITRPINDIFIKNPRLGFPYIFQTESQAIHFAQNNLPATHEYAIVHTKKNPTTATITAFPISNVHQIYPNICHALYQGEKGYDDEKTEEEEEALEESISKEWEEMTNEQKVEYFINLLLL